ncbi:Gldg family protein [Pedobacter sp.]
MRKIFKIARLELSIMFYSPVAWLVLTIFMIQCGITFLDTLQGTRTLISLGYQAQPITSALFIGQSGLFTTMQGYLYLYLPILTMGLMSRETSSGSIKLLLSSPVKLNEIILGKYLAIIIYGLLLIGVLTLYAITGSIFVSHADVGIICSGLIGLYLLICTYAAIGLFMSCLTTYQVVAAISTLALFTIMRYVGTLGQEYDFIRDITYFLSISGRTENMLSGLITTKDVFYYLIIISSFLMLCLLRLKAERELRSATVKAGRYAVLVLVALMLGYITSRPSITGYLDVTSGKSLTIAKTSQEIAKKIKGPLKVTTYANLLAPNLWHVLPQSRNTDLARMESYRRFIPGMQMDYVYYYQKPIDTNYHQFKYSPDLKGVNDIDKIADQVASSLGVRRELFISPTELKKRIDLTDEGFLLLRKLEYNGKSTYLRFFVRELDPYASEAETNAALKRLISPAPRVVFVTGNGERETDSQADGSYQNISTLKIRRKALVNQGFDVDTLNLHKQAIPANTDILVIGDPTVPFNEDQMKKILAYISRGGNMLITTEPGRQQIINPVLLQLGIQLKQGIIVEPGKAVTPGYIDAQLSEQAAAIDPNLARMQKDKLPVSIQNAAPITLIPSSGFRATPLLMSAAGSWNKVSASGINEKGVGQSNLGPLDLSTANLSFNAEQGDEKGVFPISVALTRTLKGKQQRIVVSGDADFISNGEFSRERSVFNELYLHGIFRWFSDGTYPSYVNRPPAKDIEITITKEQITGLMWLYRGIIPSIIITIGATVLIRRRRK